MNEDKSRESSSFLDEAVKYCLNQIIDGCDRAAAVHYAAMMAGVTRFEMEARLFARESGILWR